MKFWCASANSSKQRKFMHKPNDSISSSVSYATISSIPIPKSDSGYSEIASITYLEQIFNLERTYHEKLKEFIIKYSRPLRRVLNSEEIVDLFQNIEKICTISQSIFRQCEKFLKEDITSDVPISSIYQSSFGVMIDSYNAYVFQNRKAQSTLKQCEKKISYSLQIGVEWVRREISEFIQLPIRYICVLNDLFQSFMVEYSDQMNRMDWTIIQSIKLLSKEANQILQSLSSSDLVSLQSEVSPTNVLQRTNKDPWESKRLELSDSHLLFTQMNRTTRICLSDVIRINENFSNLELHLIIASKYSRYTSIEMQNVHIRFDDKHAYVLWLECLANAIQQAKDQSWSQTNELVI